MIETWAGLYADHQQIRRGAQAGLKGLRVALRALTEKPSGQRIVPSHVHSMLQREGRRDPDLLRFRLGRDDAGVPLALEVFDDTSDEKKIHLRDARLTVLVLIDRARDHLRMLTLMVESTRRAEGTPWTCAIHLPDDQDAVEADRQGRGACGHPTLHCHVGPTLDAQPQVRVPLPTMPPGRLLEWLISQIVPLNAYEAAPWPSVVPLAE